jgi:hypothetical protein
MLQFVTEVLVIAMLTANFAKMIQIDFRLSRIEAHNRARYYINGQHIETK